MCWDSFLHSLLTPSSIFKLPFESYTSRLITGYLVYEEYCLLSLFLQLFTTVIRQLTFHNFCAVVVSVIIVCNLSIRQWNVCIVFAETFCCWLIHDGLNVPRKARRALRETFCPEWINQQQKVDAKTIQTFHCYSFMNYKIDKTTKGVQKRPSRGSNNKK